ncbi:TPA: FAD-binding protein [Candidatus Poribacteria bacterium]|nr:FAD-binding protein [Candidatus Poribacteria bacterium]
MAQMCMKREDITSELQSSALRSTDVLVIGGAGAGLRAAIAAAEQGVKVALASKLPAGGMSNTAITAGWFTRSTEKSADELFYQVVYTGGYLNNQRLVEVFVKEVQDKMPQLRQYGVDLFSEDVSSRIDKPGHYQVRRIEGKSRGYGLTQPLRDTAEKIGVEILDNVMVTELLTSNQAVVGATAVDLEKNQFFVISAKSTVLATGGGARAYERSDNAEGTTGDGFALAYRAGAELVDIECISFNLPHARMEAIFTVKNPPDEEILSIGGCHYFLGGVKIDEKAGCNLDGLYAAGEVTGGLFGAARLGGSAMADTIVFGAIAGEKAAERAKSISMPVIDQTQVDAEEKWLTQMFDGGDQSPEFVSDANKELRSKPSEVASKIRSTLWRYVGTMKTDVTLLKARQELDAIMPLVNAQRVQNMTDLRTAIEARNMLDLGRVIVAASTLRKETRGCYWRIDYPKPDNENWLKNIIVTKDGDALKTKIQDAIMTKLRVPTDPPIGPGCFGYTR